MTTEILNEVRGHAGILTLNRPQALNALTLEMIREARRVVDGWAADDAVELVVIRGAGERGLCAGGDVAALYRDAIAGGHEGETFWREEYELDYTIAAFPKPVVALMSGIVLGGGVGISAHASHRVVTDDSRVGMPEVGIGYSPDAGGSYLLSRAPDGLGRHLAYTALHVGAAEAIDTGFADVFVPSGSLDGLVDTLCETGDPGVIAEFSREIGPGFGTERGEMVEIYGDAHDPVEILARLDGCHSEWAAKAAKVMRRNSPLGIRVTQRSLERNLSLDLAGTLTQEFWMSLNMQRHPEFVEGIRAQVVEKDRSPKWTYASLEDVPTDLPDSMFEPISGPTPPDFSHPKGK
ncbi:enoyl-CoA hydratase/isomerase family protein [Corynebacterium liangguodongii]|uniref:3-hydroxyisobutyryl-CoA hydrolase n=1 Tax=Corynebacterium liangguodongii TaxID=2079535 RepID=A0A2S0WD63_9CORY|nr:3-hydroxyisobutyryl-CoA hydrolase [Corynebacterium liangguodongii]AWB83708.1 enoyl-CoA hydratase/isomerase family protein [Corynebacterium liangguodongii]PWB99482.1 enoyl-CoA hydratase/isomerase family protein [Corynebacterium liangguodongii]